MQSNKNFFVPEYIQDFRCIGKDCIDSCCVGWNINIDKETYKKYMTKDVQYDGHSISTKSFSRKDSAYLKLKLLSKTIILLLIDVYILLLL